MSDVSAARSGAGGEPTVGPVRAHTVADAGTATEPSSVDSAVHLLQDSRRVIAAVANLHDLERVGCVGIFGDRSRPAAYSPEAREPCGVLSEQLWNQTSDVNGFLTTMVAFMEDRDAGMFADVDCRSLGDRELGAALHVVSLAPRLISREFLRCAVERESVSESFTFWVALSAIDGIPDATDWVPLRDYRDSRTLERIDALSAAPPASE